MPYIKPEDYHAAAIGPSNAGELNYAFTRIYILYAQGRINLPEVGTVVRKLIDEYMGTGYRYQQINDVLGALTGAYTEFSLRNNDTGDKHSEAVQRIAMMTALVMTEWYTDVVRPYEDVKIRENGDVYPEGFFPATSKEPSDAVSEA